MDQICHQIKNPNPFHETFHRYSFAPLTNSVNCCSNRYNLLQWKTFPEVKAAAWALSSAPSNAALLKVTAVDVYVHLHKRLQAEENTLLMQTLFLFEEIYLN